MTEGQWKVFFEIHHGLPREAPGGAESTRIAYACLNGVGRAPTVLDVGCGPGAQTLCLAELGSGEIHAVDTHAPFIEALRRAVEGKGLTARVHPRVADMNDLPFDDAFFDLIWAEGSIYNAGVEKALAQWKRLLKKGASIAFTEVCWLQDEAPSEARRFWAEEYPQIATIEANVKRIEDAGYALTGFFVLPESDWWNEYYNPIAEKLPALREKHAGDSAGAEVLESAEREIEMYRKYSGFYGYVFYMAQKE